MATAWQLQGLRGNDRVYVAVTGSLCGNDRASLAVTGSFVELTGRFAMFCTSVAATYMP